jgi:CheY-like chemotaxis protein
MSDFKGMGTVHRLAPQPGAKRKARILVVDDNLDTVHSMAMLIKAFGNEVDFAINGFAAIAAARKFRPDVILLDINLPDFKGDKLAQQLKYEPGLENVRIIALSGNSDEGTKARAIEAGCEAYHVKPLEPALLEELLTKT